MMISFEDFSGLIVRELETDPQITPDTKLVEDLELESFEIIHLVVIVEDLLGEQLPDELIPTLSTIGDLYHHYEARISDIGVS